MAHFHVRSILMVDYFEAFLSSQILRLECCTFISDQFLWLIILKLFCPVKFFDWNVALSYQIDYYGCFLSFSVQSNSSIGMAHFHVRSILMVDYFEAFLSSQILRLEMLHFHIRSILMVDYFEAFLSGQILRLECCTFMSDRLLWLILELFCPVKFFDWNSRVYKRFIAIIYSGATILFLRNKKHFGWQYLCHTPVELLFLIKLLRMTGTWNLVKDLCKYRSIQTHFSGNFVYFLQIACTKDYCKAK
jgi:hypothetical protein